MEQAVAVNEFKGYSLFNDITDVDLRDRNRAVVMCNMSEQYTKNKLISRKGISMVCGYFYLIPEDQRTKVISNYEMMMQTRGYDKSSEGV